MKIKRYVLLSNIISFLFVSFTILSIPHTKGYEVSIYSATPTIFWISIIIGLLNGIYIIILVFYKKIDQNWIILGVFEIILFNTLVIILYAIKGYIFYFVRGDTASYIGMAKDISGYGTFFDYNFYPLTSILISQLNQISNISINEISKYLSSLFFGSYILFIYCWSKSLYEDKKFIYASIISATPILFPWFSTSIYHMLLSVLSIPILFYCIRRSLDIRFRFLSIILIITYPFFHPITAVIVIIYLLTIYIYELINEDKIDKMVSIELILMAFITFIGWITWQYYILHDVKLIILQIIGSFDAPTTANQAEYFFQKLGLVDILRSFLISSIHQIIFYIISIIGIFYILKDRKKKLLSSAICLLIGSIFILVLFFTSRSHTPDRLIYLNPNMTLMSPIMGYAIYKSRYRGYMFIGIVFSLVIVIFSVYQSPIIIRPNDQATNYEMKSMDWLISRKNVQIKTIDLQSPIFRYADAIYGSNFSLNRGDLHNYDYKVKDHFGNQNDIFRTYEDRYLIITRYDILAYTKVWKKVNRFNEDDFISIDLSNNINKIFDNKEVFFYLVKKRTLIDVIKLPENR